MPRTYGTVETMDLDCTCKKLKNTVHNFVICCRKLENTVHNFVIEMIMYTCRKLENTVHIFVIVFAVCVYRQSSKIVTTLKQQAIWNGWMEAFFYTEGIQLTAAHSVVDVLTSPRRKCNIYGATTFIPRDSILTSLVLVHADYLFCN